MTIVPPNALRIKLHEGHLAVGCMLVEVRQPSIMAILANAGFDWVIIDNEHGPFSVETIAELSRAGRDAGVTPVVRIPELTYAHVAQSLDGGAQGIMLPRVTARAQVEQCLEFMKYPPMGRRGAVLGRGHTGFKGGGLSEVLAAFNRETFLVVQIETREAVERLDDILSVPGVDAALVGPTDLSLSLGVPGEMSAELLTGAIERTLAACARHKVIPAIHTNDVAMTTAWARKGMRLVSISSEVGLLIAGVKAAIGQIRA
jgi:2-dehydro-3-deoxyglucarate aldolase/4-hydroxy-2-oxoheptanedioate aldolase